MSKIFLILSILQLLVVTVYCGRRYLPTSTSTSTESTESPYGTMKPKFYCDTSSDLTLNYYEWNQLGENSYTETTTISDYYYYKSVSCLLNDLYLTRKSPGFIPVAPNEDTVTHLQVKSYSMKVLTSDICNTFPNLRVMSLAGLGIEEINSDAFENCANLETLYLKDNSLVSLPSNIFKNNKKLTSLSLADNPIVQLDVEIFKGLNRFRNLYLINNSLLDFKVETLYDYCPIKYFELGRTHILCQRYDEILAFIYNHDHYHSWNTNRSCLDNDEYMNQIMKVNLTDTILQAKIDYLYKELQRLKYGNNYIPNDDSSTEYYWNDGYSTEYYFGENGNIVIPIWLMAVAASVGVFLLFVTFVSLISCIRARCALRRQNNQYQHLQT